MWLRVFLLAVCLTTGWAECYFPFEYHGTYAVQSGKNQYSEVLIEVNRILPYGNCYRRIGNNLILRDGSNGCLRCFHLAIRSPNVLQLHTRDPQSSCATNLDDTLKLCPTLDEMSSPQAMNSSKIHELMMYKTRTASDEAHVHQVYCPISGRYLFRYDVDDGTESWAECSGQLSELSNCPFGFGLELRFRGCSLTQNLSMTFQCLGDWKDYRGNKYMALLDVEVADDRRPRYRCAMYREEPGTGRIYMALSSDSSCHRRLQDARRGYERLVLQPTSPEPWPAAVRRADCRLPDWARGRWQHASIRRSTVVYRDTRHFKTYTAKCISAHGNDKYVIYARSQCGEETYNCLWLKKRGTNVMEFQLGLSPSSVEANDICGPHQFTDSGWITQGHDAVSGDEVRQEAACPVAGEYEGVIPNTAGQLCAKLYSDCNSPEIMFYTVINCLNASDIYEEREYRCLGTWTERGVMYTYTQRRDVLAHECFAGQVMEDGRIYIEEAGIDQSCQRAVQPARSGMLITKIAPCYNNIAEQIPTTQSTTTAPTSLQTRPPPPPPTGRRPRPPHQQHDWESGTERTTQRTTTKPWRPITAAPDQRGSSGAVRPPAVSLLPLTVAVLLLLRLLR